MRPTAMHKQMRNKLPGFKQRALPGMQSKKIFYCFRACSFSKRMRALKTPAHL